MGRRSPAVMMTLVISAFMAVMTVRAAAQEADGAAVTAEEFLSSFDFRMGRVEMPNGAALMEVPDSFRYIGPDDARRFLEEGWGNPDGSGTLGMLLPVDTDLLGGEGWGVVITYQEDGHVSDRDAAGIDYGELLASMQEETREASSERVKLGYEPVELVGWAAPPRYDGQAKKLYWAKEIRFGDAERTTLNYNVRILGRKGVLVMNAVSGMPQLPRVEDGIKQVLAFTEFREGHRYSDFDPGIDKIATYGIAALVGGKVAAKAGLLAKLGALLLALKKFVVLAVAAVGTFLAKLFRRRGRGGAGA